ncbi:MAG: glycosyltransferase family 1 protein [Oscillochloris sp.]|nr:glycosyltransferase family 1 protein [Oscillochloris sp.]
MQIALLALGSRGDVQPFIALGCVLHRAGHAVRLIGLADYADLAADYGIEYHAVVGAARELMDVELVYAALDAAGKRLPLDFARRFVAQISPLITRLYSDCLAACRNSDLLVAATLGMYPGLFLAEKLGLPLVPAHFHPHGISAVMPDLSFAAAPPWMPLGRLYHRLTHHLSAHGLWQLLRGPLNRARREALDLAPLSIPALWRQVRRSAPLSLYGYSAIVAPPASDWPAQRRITGYWLLDKPGTFQAPADLEHFLAAGEPPVYIGFGSVLAGRNPAAITALLAAALSRAGVRGLIYRGAWGDLAPEPLPDHMLAIDAIPHNWLFPQTAAVVTHGGAGTVAAALCAGVPIITVPFYGDQRFWGRRIAELGAGVPPIPRAGLSVERLAAAIRRAISDQGMRSRAAVIGAHIAAEDGPAVAAAALLRK